ncbi:g4398 [Coccomyxa elongata]
MLKIVNYLGSSPRERPDAGEGSDHTPSGLHQGFGCLGLHYTVPGGGYPAFLAIGAATRPGRPRSADSSTETLAGTAESMGSEPLLLADLGHLEVAVDVAYGDRKLHTRFTGTSHLVPVVKRM